LIRSDRLESAGGRGGFCNLFYVASSRFRTAEELEAVLKGGKRRFWEAFILTIFSVDGAETIL